MSSPTKNPMSTPVSMPRPYTPAVRPLYWSFGNDMLIAIAVVGMLLYSIAPDLRGPVMRARLAQVFTLEQQIRQHQMIEHAVHGRWANEMPDGAIQLSEGMSVSQALFTNGHFSLALRLPDSGGTRSLSFRRAENPALGTRFWYCGHAVPDPLAAVTIPDITEIPAAWLPSSCRASP